MVQPTTIYSALQSFDQQNKGAADICGTLRQSEVNGLGSMHYLTITTPKACGSNLELKFLQYTFPWQNPNTKIHPIPATEAKEHSERCGFF